MPLVDFTDRGLYCSQGQFYIDPWQPTEKAIITHAHSDHAKWGSKYYLCHHFTKPLLQLRLGNNNYESVEWNQPVYMNGVKITLHPAGHIIGSSQIRIEYNGEVWVVSGDYKTENDGISGALEPVLCHTFITESTFGLPIYHWKPQQVQFAAMQAWIQQNKEQGRTSLLLAYSLGKAQRLIKNLAGSVDHVFVHGAVYNTQQALKNAGWQFPETEKVTNNIPRELFHRNLVIAPASVADSPWIKKMEPVSTGVCSGWMQVRGNARRKNADAGFALSDHADWNGLLETVKATGASRVFVTHGFQSAFSRYLNENGIESAEIKTAFGNEEDSETLTEQAENKNGALPDNDH
ncbi:MAG: ligase-associated DNA damage response exonuclease [Bacteroidota bacterium]